jgi:hypothetical protein
VDHLRNTVSDARRLSENYDSRSLGPGEGISILIQTGHRPRRGNTKPPFSGSRPFKNALSSLSQHPLGRLDRILHAPIAPDLEEIMSQTHERTESPAPPERNPENTPGASSRPPPAATPRPRRWRRPQHAAAAAAAARSKAWHDIARHSAAWTCRSG